MTNSRRIKSFIYAAVVVASLSIVTFLSAGWAAVEQQKFAQSDKTSITVLEPSRYLESGYYAPVDTNGDSHPDNWIAGEFEAGATVLVVPTADTLSPGPTWINGLGFFFWALLVAVFPVGITLILTSTLIDRLLASRRARQWSGEYQKSPRLHSSL